MTAPATTIERAAKERPTTPACWRVALQLRKVRESLGLSVRQVAKRAAVSHVYWCEVERGEKLPGANWTLHVAAMLGIERRQIERAWLSDAGDLALAEMMRAQRDIGEESER